MRSIVSRLRSLCIVAVAASLGAVPARGQDLLLRGGQRFDGRSMVPNEAILVRRGRIYALDAAAVAAPRDSSQPLRAIELGTDDYIVPGFFDLHAHYGMELLGRDRADETVVNPVVYLANGVTSTFPAGEMNPDRMRRLRLDIEAGRRAGPRVWRSGPYFGAARPGWNRQAMTADSICAEVDHWAAEGVAGFKAKRIDPASLRALIRCAHRHGLTVTAHLDSGWRNTVNPRDAIRMGIDRVEHFLGGDDFAADSSAYSSLVNFSPASPGFDAIVRLYLQHRVYFDPTLTAYGYYGERDPRAFTKWTDEMRFLAPWVRDSLEATLPRPVNTQFERIYRAKLKTVEAFYRAGGAGLIVVGTDHPSWGEFLSGFSIHREMQALVLAGIPPAAVLRAATINAAAALGVSDRLGSLEVGKWGDLVVLRGDPLRDIARTRSILHVVKGGEVYDPTALLRSVEGRLLPPDPPAVPVQPYR